MPLIPWNPTTPTSGDIPSVAGGADVSLQAFASLGGSTGIKLDYFTTGGSVSPQLSNPETPVIWRTPEVHLFRRERLLRVRVAAVRRPPAGSLVRWRPKVVGRHGKGGAR